VSPFRGRRAARRLSVFPLREIVMPVQSLALLLVLIGGALLSIQAPLNTTLGRAVGSPVNAALVSFLVGAAALGGLATLLRVTPNVVAVRALPWWAWMGGACGAFFVASAAYAAPRIGVATMLTLGVASQLVAAIAIDHLGALGVAQRAVSTGRVVGVLLVIAGAVLVRRG